MKKLIALVLALALALSATMVLAEEATATPAPVNSKTGDDIQNSDVEAVETATPAPAAEETTTTTTTTTTKTTTNYAAQATATPEPTEEPKQVISQILTTSAETTKLIAEFAAAAASGDGILSVFPEDVQEGIEEGYTTINEIVSVILDGDLDEVTSLTLSYSFKTEYPVGETVYLAYGITDADGNTQWILVKGIVTEKGVEVTLNEEQIKLLAGKTATLAVISKD